MKIYNLNIISGKLKINKKYILLFNDLHYLLINIFEIKEILV